MLLQLYLNRALLSKETTNSPCNIFSFNWYCTWMCVAMQHDKLACGLEQETGRTLLDWALGKLLCRKWRFTLVALPPGPDVLCSLARHSVRFSSQFLELYLDRRCYAVPLSLYSWRRAITMTRGSCHPPFNAKQRYKAKNNSKGQTESTDLVAGAPEPWLQRN